MSATMQSAETPSEDNVRGITGMRPSTVALVICAVLTAAGVALWGRELAVGMMATGMRDLASWGVYIMMFMLFVGVGAGALIVAAAPRILGLERYAFLCKPAAWCALCSMIVAAAFIVIDLGQPARMFELAYALNFASPLSWDVLAVAAFIIVAAVYVGVLVRANRANATSDAAVRVWAVVALIAGIAVVSVDGWIFSLQAGREMWHTALLAPWFTASALLSGLGLTLVACLALRRAHALSFGAAQLGTMAKWLGAFSCLDLYFLASDLLVSGYAGDGQAAALLTSGLLAPVFWIQVASQLACAIICFTPRLRRASGIAIAGALAVIGAACKRIELIVGGFQLPTMAYPGPTSSHTLANAAFTLQESYVSAVYSPSLGELGIVICVLAFGVLIALLGFKLLPLSSDDGRA